jgi:tRNA(Ile)-lysidine synthase
VKKFIDKEWDRKSPLLLGYSGGPDSKSLLYALLKTAAASLLHLAHVDHGWREESASEAKLLAEEAKALGLPFHTIRLLEPLNGNLEDAARSARLSFFRSLFDQIPFQALLLAHHADDAAETALKRLLEGAHLQNLGGMAKIGFLQDMAVWRPFLDVRKKEILKANLPAFDDATNRDPKFLRSRMRLEILPRLSESFGKEVSENLALFSERAFELREYLDRKIASVEVLEGPWGKAAHLAGVERFEARHFLLKWSGASRNILESVLDNLESVNLQFGPFIVERGWVFLPSEKLPQFGQEVTLRSGRFVSGDWEIEISQEEAPNLHCTWKDLWKGEFSLLLPGGVLKMADNISSEEYRIARVPVFLRPFIPGIPGCNEKNLFAKFFQPRWHARFFVGVKSLCSAGWSQREVPP